MLSYWWCKRVVDFEQYEDVEGGSLQKCLTVIPLMKLIQVTCYTAYAGSCPWQNQVMARYLLMCLVTLSTIYQTVFVSILLMMSKGWSIARSSLSRDDLSLITLIMGSIYLVYSAFYISISVDGMRIFITAVLNVLYLIVMVIVLKNCCETRMLLKAQQKCIHENEIDQLKPSIDLKVSIMTKYMVISFLYFSCEIFLNGVMPSV